MGGYWSIEHCGWREGGDALATPWSVRGIGACAPPCPADAADVLRMPARVATVPQQASPAEAGTLLPA